MKVCGIISEYNPFHNGHLYQIKETRQMGATHIIAVMSGNYVQRGDTALMDKFSRARLAVEDGVDLVLELPVGYSLSSAEYFARGAVSILHSLGCVDQISFGSECGEIAQLQKPASAAEALSNSPALIELLEKGSTYPAALQKLILEEYGAGTGEIFSHPNNLLGIEYLKALRFFNTSIQPLTLQRKSAAHDSSHASEHMASASYIRRAVLEGTGYSRFVPREVSKALSYYAQNGWLANLPYLEPAILYHFRRQDARQIENLPDVSHGLENRIVLAARKARSLEELLFSIKSKRYTLAKVRRILLSGLLGLQKAHLHILPPYARLLAMNDAGCEILQHAKKTSSIPIGTQLLKLAECGSNSKIFAELEAASTDIYALASEKIRPCGMDYTAKIQKQSSSSPFIWNNF